MDDANGNEKDHVWVMTRNLASSTDESPVIYGQYEVTMPLPCTPTTSLPSHIFHASALLGRALFLFINGSGYVLGEPTRNSTHAPQVRVATFRKSIISAVTSGQF